MSRKVGLGREFHELMKMHDRITNFREDLIRLASIIESQHHEDVAEKLLYQQVVGPHKKLGRYAHHIASSWANSRLLVKDDPRSLLWDATRWIALEEETARKCAVRSGMKYTVPPVTLPSGELYSFDLTTPLRLPFPWTTVSIPLVPSSGDDFIPKIIIYMEYRTAPKEGYQELGLLAGEEFICMSPHVVREHFGIMPTPAEIHFKLTEDPEPEMVEAWLSKPSKLGEDMLSSFAALGLTWWEMLNSRGTHARTHSGLKPSLTRKIKPHHGHRYPRFEHVVLEREIDPDPDPRGESIARAPGQVRKHFRSGHWRHYSKPLKSGPNAGRMRTWVRDSAPGNAELGILKTDLVLTNKEKE
tara:strand:+ start:5418 stop:6491 length:1074 start_codon:yes stop_codon:yes gene_type:complete